VKDNILGWFQGKMEFGPRALGSRSILANPKHVKMKSFVNLIKRREKFRPFAGSVLEENVHDLFDIPKDQSDFSFMNFCFRVKQNKKKFVSAIVHKDNTCRIQTVRKSDGIYYRLIKEFYRITGTPCILNTSFNIDGEPIVENPEQAIKDFLNNPIDYLIIGNFIVSK
jgi:carbamoyltransferase